MIRELTKSDFNDYKELISQLTEIGNVTVEQFQQFLDSRNGNFQTLVYEFNNKAVGSITFIIEQKLSHSFMKVMHIEDVITNSSYRSMGIASSLIKWVIDIAIQKGCYKIVLNCKSENIPFYSKFDFTQKETQMSLYLK